MSFERFCQPVCFFAARFTLRQPKTPVGNATNLRTFCFEDYHWTINIAFKRLFVLSHSLIRSLYFIQVYIFIPLIHSAPFLRFSHILLTPIFSYEYYHGEYFSYPWWCRWTAKARNLIYFFNFSIQRPHLNYILLSNVIVTLNFLKI